MIDTTYLQPEEIDVVQKIVSQKNLGRPFCDRLVIKLYQEPEMTKGGILKPDITKENELYNTVAGMVVGIGPDCFKTGKYKDSDEKGCQIGDWVVVSYKEPNRFKFQNVTLVYTYDDCLLDRLTDPSEIKRG